MCKVGHGWLSKVFVLCLLPASGCEDDGESKPRQRADAAIESDAGTDAAIDEPTRAVAVSGPIEGAPLTTSVVDLAEHGYSEKEFFYEGEPTTYSLEGEMSQHGRWSLVEGVQQSFKSRLLVRRPLEASQFNGTVVVEWLNVSGGADGDPGFMYNWEELLRDGYVWVGVSAQATGVEGGGFSLVPGPSRALKVVNPERYGSLSHPGDAYSYDIYTRAAQIVRGAGDVLSGLSPKRLLAYGEIVRVVSGRTRETHGSLARCRPSPPRVAASRTALAPERQATRSSAIPT